MRAGPLILSVLLPLAALRALDAQDLRPLTGPIDQPRWDWLHDGNDHEPDWAPDGEKILFTRVGGSKYQLFTVRPDGSDLQQITFGPGANWLGAYSSDGSRIAFISTRDGEQALYVVDADGSNPVRLIGGGGGKPAWSPDGRRLAFTTNRAGNQDIWVVDADGSNLRAVTIDEVNESHPAWSPDGTRIAFNRATDGHQDIWTIRSDGSGLTRLTSNPGYEGNPSWSPDGSRIAFLGIRNGESAIWTIRADGSGIERLTHAPNWNFDPHWSPDGSQIVFDSRRDGVRGLWVMNADGSEERKITATETSAFVERVRTKGARAALAELAVAAIARPEATFFRPWEVIVLADEKLASGEPMEAALLLEEVVRRHPTTVHAVNSLRRAYHALGRPAPPERSELLRVFEEAGVVAGIARLTAASFEFPSLRILRASDLSSVGTRLSETGDLDGGIAVLEVGVTMYPQHAALWETLGDLLIQAGRPDRGAEALERALELDPDDVPLARKLNGSESRP